MKRIFVLMMAVATLFAQDVVAQQQTAVNEAQKGEHKAKREELMQARLDLLKTELTLTDEQMTKFDPVYRKYRSEIQMVTKSNRDARVKKENITNENALKVLSARLANQILTATVKQRYLMVFAEVIEPLQVMKLYKVDEKISREAHKVIKYRETAANEVKR